MPPFTAHAPANIALIKYMGKADAATNLPSTASLSLTLPHLRSYVQLLPTDAPMDKWAPLKHPDCPPTTLSPAQQARYLAHLQRIKQALDYTGSFHVQSANTFAAGTGLASSAASFAALTLGAAQAITTLQQRPLPDVQALAQLSRQGSGSSCRSFFPQWALWEGESVQAIDLPLPPLTHLGVIVDTLPKAVPSSEAHQRVPSSPHFTAWQRRLPQRLEQLITYAQQQAWEDLYHLVKEEFEEMHHLFHTAEQPFQYITRDTEQVLADIALCWRENGTGPLVTLDAGPNVHLLFRPQDDGLRQELHTHFLERYGVL